MKKTAIALALASTVALTACGNDEPDGTDTGMEDPTVSQWEQPEVRGPLQDTDQEDVDKVAHCLPGTLNIPDQESRLS